MPMRRLVRTFGMSRYLLLLGHLFGLTLDLLRPRRRHLLKAAPVVLVGELRLRATN
jgi:hypothetical protein